MKTVHGKELLMYKDYTFSKSGGSTQRVIRYGCSKRFSLLCPARLTMFTNGHFRSSINLNHNHEPPRHAFTADGLYMYLS